MRRIPVVTYLAELTAPRFVLWCYLIWWTFTVSRYFDPSPRLWLSSLGLSVIIGTALYLSTAYGGKTKTSLDRFQIARLYAMPFCVSSFAALIKDRGFVLVFHPTIAANAAGLVLWLGFGALVCLVKQTRPIWETRTRAPGATADGHADTRLGHAGVSDARDGG